ncbi:RNA-binding cell elongation regulator Jag/EloR [Chungangia koreensis]|uniref:RNA-binding protein KhpB n=1 Tax=Chungangia koreensis TaxID=752657 RepID=A0ABV8X9J6_9LACT
MKRMTQTGTTVEEAVKSALSRLGVDRNQVKVDIISEGKKGFLGFGSKPAEVEVTVIELDEPTSTNITTLKEEAVEVEPALQPNENISETLPEEKTSAEEIQHEKVSPETAIEETKLYLSNVAKAMNIEDLSISHEVNGKYVTISMESEKAALLIGKRGHTLNSLQQLAQLVANKHAGQFLLIELDVENYRERRQEALEQLAERMADKAVRSGKKVEFEPMPSYERKVIHHTLSNRLDIETYSEGTEPHRHLVIEPIK